MLLACAVSSYDGLAMAKLLYQHGARESITLPARCGELPLHLACNADEHNSAAREGMDLKPLVEWLLAHGARPSVNHADRTGCTALTAACFLDSEVPWDRDLCELLAKNGATDTVSTCDPFWRNGDFSLSAMAWVLKRFGTGVSDESAAHAFRIATRRWTNLQAARVAGRRLSRDQGTEGELVELTEAILLLRRPHVVCEVVGPLVPAALVELAVRIGVDAQYLQEHPQWEAVVHGLVAQRRAFVSAFLFGCLRSSGSTFLWCIGSQYSMAGFRTELAAFAGVVCEPVEWQRVRSMHALVVARRGSGERAPSR